jgi:predicted ferric reductase
MMTVTNTSPVARNPASKTAPLPVHSTLADLSWWLVGALSVAAVVLAMVLTLVLRALTGEITLAWFISRGAGVVGYLLITGSMIYGLMITTRTATGAVPAPVSFGMHEFIAWLGLVFIAVHAVVLLWDGYIKYSLASVLVPFASSYRPVWVGIGQIAFYLSALLAASFYAKKRIGHKTWRLIHYASFATFILATLHGLFSGSDTKALPMQAIYISAVAAVLFLTVLRILLPRGRVRSGV